MKSTAVSQLRTVPQRISNRVSSLPPSGIRQFFDLVADMPDVVSLGVGEPDFPTPWHICEAGIHSLETSHTSYTSNSGMLELRREIALYLEREHLAEYDPVNQILVTVGGSEAIDLACRTLLEPEDEIIVIDPSFVSYAPLVTLAGGRARRVATTAENSFRPRIEDLEAAITPATRAMIVNYPNNPTGVTLETEHVEAIAEFVLRHQLILISDEIYLPLSYEGRGVSFTSIPELRDHLLLIHGFSKAWAMTGWRLGMAAGPQDIITAMTKIHQYSIMCAPTTAQHAAIEALRFGAEEVENMRREYDTRRRYMAHHFNRMGLECVVPRGAFYIFPRSEKPG